MNVLRENTVRAVVGGRVRIAGRIATIVATTDELDQETGEMAAHIHAVRIGDQGKPEWLDAVVHDPTAVEPPLSPVAVARMLWRWLGACRGAFTADQERAIAAAEALVKLDRGAA